MKKTIHHLRQKTQGEKEAIALWGAVSVTLFIVLFWLAGITATSNPTENQKADVGTPFSDIVESVSGIFKK